MWYAIIAFAIFVLTLVFIWKKIIPLMVDKRAKQIIDVAIIEFENRMVNRLIDFNNKEVVPIVQAISAYAPIVEEIYKDLDKIQDDLDLIASEGQAKAKPKTVLLPPADIDFDIEEVEEIVANNFLSPNTKPIIDPLPLEGHTLLVGQNGSGKTNTLMVSILSRMQAGHNIHLIDSKNELAQIFENHMEVYKAIDVLKVVRKLTQVAKDRMEMFGRVGREMGEPIRDIWEYREITGKNMPIITLVVEELIMITDMVDAEELTELYIAGRASGVFVFACTQLLKADILPRKCTANIMNRVYMGAPDKIAMRVLFTGGIPNDIRNQAHTHLGPSGKALYYNGNKNEFALVTLPRVDRDILKGLMK